MAETSQPSGLSVHDAVKVAASHLESLFPGLQHVMLEEVELSEDDRYWYVTLSFIPTGNYAPPNAEGVMRALGGGRKYKIVKVDRTTGQVRSVKIRDVEHV